MPLVWIPDFCPPGQGRCSIEIERDWSAPRAFSSRCTHHQSLQSTLGLSDAQLFTVILQSSRCKEIVKWALKSHMALDEDHPGLPFVVNADGSISIRSGLTGQARTAARAVAAAALLSVTRPPGTSAVTVD